MAGSSVAGITRVAMAAAICGVAGLAGAVAPRCLAAAEQTAIPAQVGEVPDVFNGGEPAAVMNDEACMQELRRCCCCPSWTHYAIFDVLFLQRNNAVGNQPLIYDSVTQQPVMTAQDVTPGIGTGVRLFYGSLCTDSLGWEVGYTGIYGMFGQANVAGPGTLIFPPDLGYNPALPQDGNTARATYWSTLNIAEANVFCYDCCQECGPTHCPLTNCKSNCHCINWMAGFIWAGLNEQANLGLDCCSPPETTSYNVRTTTNYYGGQIGMRGRREWQRWAVEGWWKTAVCGTSANQAADPIIGAVSQVPVRGAQSASAAGMGFIGSLNGTVIYRLTDAWGLRAGYNCYWLTNAALAPSQYDFTDVATSGSGINDNGTLFLHGANLGVERRW